MQTIEYRPMSRWWLWSAAVASAAGVFSFCWVTFVLGWGALGEHVAERPRGSAQNQVAVLLLIGLIIAVPALMGLNFAAGLTRLQADGIRMSTPLRRRLVPWHDIASISGEEQENGVPWRRGIPLYRIRLTLRSGETFCLPAPVSGEFDSALEAAKGEIIRRWKAATAAVHA
ncbi:PH domain-containing protein [Streptomyces sp. NPDC057654]|uniref:PH domain-containing protein n=1 Tax=Streptomyces sp. NPDC057654 TaxID=3346196 RepID=UPI0036A513B4